MKTTTQQQGAHTAGPWFVDGSLITSAAITGWPDAIVAEMFAGSLIAGGARRANALLIAAAPELLAVLMAVADETLCYETGPKPFSADSYLPEKFKDLIRAALAKASGDA